MPQRGLKAPQNTFLETVMKRSQGEEGENISFLIANAQIIGFPIVFVSEQFSKLVGYRYSPNESQNLT